MGVCHSRRPAKPKPALDVDHVLPGPSGTAEAPEALEPGLKEEAAGSQPSQLPEPSQPTTVETTSMLRVIGLSGAPLLEVEAEKEWSIGHVKLQVVAAQRIQCHPWQLKLQLRDRPLKDVEVLNDLVLEEALPELTAVVVKETVAGIYAAFTCSILVLHENGRVAYGWYDDYWSSPLRESCGPVQTTFIAEDRNTTGNWTVEGITLKITAVEEDMDDNLQIEASVASSADALKEGISEMILVAKLWHSFNSTEPEEKTFYKVWEWSMDDTSPSPS
eukprot:symbB.v1.2.025217.t1/scaffold2438.1/size79063/2